MENSTDVGLTQKRLLRRPGILFPMFLMFQILRGRKGGRAPLPSQKGAVADLSTFHAGILSRFRRSLTESTVRPNRFATSSSGSFPSS